MPSIQTSLEIAVPCGVGQMLPASCMPSVRQYMVIGAHREAGQGCAGEDPWHDRRQQCRADRHLADRQHLEEVGRLHPREDGKRTRRHVVHSSCLLVAPAPLAPPRVEDVAAGGQTGGQVTQSHRSFRNAKNRCPFNDKRSRSRTGSGSDSG